jgi:hypothetical protein
MNILYLAMNFFKKLFGTNSTTPEVSKKVIEDAVDIFFEYYDRPEHIADKIGALPIPLADQEILYHFIPHLFCRLFLPEINYATYYVVVNASGKEEQVSFASSATFVKAMQVIKNNWDHYLDRDIMKVLFHSADFKAANQMLHQGSALEDLHSVPPRIVAADKV